MILRVLRAVVVGLSARSGAAGAGGFVLLAVCSTDAVALPQAPTLADARPAPDIPDGVRDLSALVREKIIATDVPGAAVALVRGRTVVALGAAGVRRAGDSEPVTIEDPWHLGSCTKAMTATLCAVLVERGILRWDMTLAEAFPDLRESMHEGYRRVTLLQLLTHHAGVPGDLNEGGLWMNLFNFKGTPTAARRMLLEGVVSRPPRREPGFAYEYSNGGYAIAGHMCESLTGIPYETLMRDELFKPLGMSSAAWGAPGGSESAPAHGAAASTHTAGFPLGHDAAGRSVAPDAPWADNPVAISPAGRLHCTITDWAKFVSMFTRGAAWNPNRDCQLLKAETFDLLVKPGPDRAYACGWGTTSRAWAGSNIDGPGRWDVFNHSGSNTLWYCATWVAPGKDFAVLACINKGGPKMAAAVDSLVWAAITDQLRAMEAEQPPAPDAAPIQAAPVTPVR